MKPMTAHSWTKFSKGFLTGSRVGCLLIVVGLLEWGIVTLMGLETTHLPNSGLSLLPLYVLSFGLGGGAVTFLRSDAPTWIESLVAWGVAALIVLAGLVVMALLVVSSKPISPYWGALGSMALLALLITTALSRKASRKVRPENVP